MRSLMTMILVVGAYTVGINDITYVEVLDYVEDARVHADVVISYVERMIEFANDNGLNVNEITESATNYVGMR